MSNNKVYKTGFFVLLVVNVVVIAFLVIGPNPPPRGLRGPGRPGQNDLKIEISDRLNLSGEQEDTYFQLAAEHRENMLRIETAQKVQTEQYLGFLKKADPSEKAMGEILAKLSQLESDKASVTYNHFDDLKKMCNASQLADFDKIMDQVIGVLINKGKNNPPPPRDH